MTKNQHSFANNLQFLYCEFYNKGDKVKWGVCCNIRFLSLHCCSKGCPQVVSNLTQLSGFCKPRVVRHSRSGRSTDQPVSAQILNSSDVNSGDNKYIGILILIGYCFHFFRPETSSEILLYYFINIYNLIEVLNIM